MVFAWPDYTRGNPYQSLLYAANAYGAAYRFAPIEAAIELLEKESAAVPVVFHLHWLGWLLDGVRKEGVAFRLVTDFIAKLNRFKQLGGLLVWTLHNEMSHEALDTTYGQFFQAEELALIREILRLADAVHVHDLGSLEEITTFKVPRHKAVEVPHGHYCGVYPNDLSRDEARQKLGFKDDESVVLFFGMVRRYKGVEELVAAFRQLLKERQNLRLLLVGRMLYDPLEEVGDALSPAERSAIRVHTGFVPDEEIQTFFGAADFAVFPYRRVLTSGSLMLALSFGVPTAVADVAMTRTVLSAGELGRTIPHPGTVEQITEALGELAIHRERLGSGISEADQSSFRERFQWRDFSLEVLKPLVERHRSSSIPSAQLTASHLSWRRETRS